MCVVVFQEVLLLTVCQTILACTFCCRVNLRNANCFTWMQHVSLLCHDSLLLLRMRSVSAVASFECVQFEHGLEKFPRKFGVIRNVLVRRFMEKKGAKTLLHVDFVW
jgi:hypothetical protein